MFCSWFSLQTSAVQSTQEQYSKVIGYSAIEIQIKRDGDRDRENKIERDKLE